MDYPYNNIFKVVSSIFLIFIYSCDQPVIFSGDAVSIEKNWVFYPKFRAKFESIPIKRSFERRYRFKGIPSNKYSLVFELQSQDGRRRFKADEINNVIWDQLQKADILLKVEVLIDGTEISSVEPKPFLLSWTFAGLGDIRYFWNKDFVDLILNLKAEYHLNISIQTRSDTNTIFVLVPIIEGGGIVIGL